MDKATSIVAAFEAGKLPSTQQVNQFIDWLDKVGITSTETLSTGNLSSRGRLLANRVRDVLDAYKQLGMNKNGDNILQEAMWHLSEGDITNITTPKTTSIDKDKVTSDINAIRSSLRSLLSVFWTSLASESSSLLNEFASFTRLSLADAAELIEVSASGAKEGLRDIEKGVEKGERTNITGRSKERVEAEQGDAKVQWEHGIDAMKGAGDHVIDAGRGIGSFAQDKVDRTSGRVHDAYLKICDRTQSDSAFRDSIDMILSVIQKRLNQSMDSAASASAQNFSLSSFINDPSPEQHVPKALHIFQTLLERLSSTPLDPVMDKAHICVSYIGSDSNIRGWFDEFFDLARKNLTQPGYVRSGESKHKRKDLRERWKVLLEKDSNWKRAIDDLKTELSKFQNGIDSDKDLNILKDAHAKLGADIEGGLVEVGGEAETGLEALMERTTWFWQDIIRVYLPRMVSVLGDLPIPRTEYKDSEIEFVLENLDISSLNLLPSHVYIRNITDVDIKTSSSPESSSQTSIGTLTRIKIEALQLTLKDVSFWYKDLQATALAPSEFTGLLGFTLPAQGVAVDIKVRLIPHTIAGPGSRHQLNHFHVVEYVKVEISEDVKMEVKESNHGILFSMFKPIFVMRFREALEKTLAGQIRAAIEWVDGVAWDVGKRREVFEDTGLGGGASVFAALWSEIGRFKRERLERGEAEVGWKATGTGVIVEQQQSGADVQFAMGAEPQILSGKKRGPLGTASEPLGERIGDVVKDATGMDIDVNAGDVQQAGQRAKAQVKGAAGQAMSQAQGLVQEGQTKIQTFKKSVGAKKANELNSDGWRSQAFDI
ncbi:hypothetical protein BDZ94DRAFT_1271588 [Collybia nuda]|uniref:Uncharacterized protein n=1 Tax=Collybia nuda TaxID=64659 RepID=A0A9P5XYP3_9AGAR|nr:hypothetical protein BDZ94DRAFT_1271588 [Collybia nuda]